MPAESTQGMDLQAIGRLIQARRLTLGLSQQRLARLAGLSRATINQLENGSLVDRAQPSCLRS